MKLIKQIIPIVIIITLMTSCASSKIVLSSNADVSKYKYVIFGSESSGDRELDDIVMAVQNQIAETNLKVLSASDILKVLECSDSILTPNIHVTSEKWDGGYTYIIYHSNAIMVSCRSFSDGGYTYIIYHSNILRLQ